MTRDKDLRQCVDGINAEFQARGFDPINDEQIECLSDPSRADEALDMLDDWEARLGLSAYWRGELSAYVQDNYHIHQRG